MAAGGYKEFVAGETLDQDEINDYLMQGMLVFAGTAARGSAIGTPVEGQFTYLSDSDSVEFFDGSQWTELSAGGVEFEYLIIAGGGGAGQGDNTSRGGAGGAGGYRCSVVGENSGGGDSAEPKVTLLAGINYTVTIGAGGAGRTAGDNRGAPGNTSAFGPIWSTGGASGGREYQSASGHGGSGAGGGAQNLSVLRYGSPGIPGQGYAGGNMQGSSANAGGGGGAGGAGAQPTAGVGVSSSITGTPVTRATGGPGNTNSSGSSNTGDGGGSGFGAQLAGNGGSGVVILRYPSSITLTIGAGLTSSTITVGGNKVTTFTAGSDTVSF